MSDIERRYIGGVEIREADGQPTIRGYAAVFDSPSVDLGGFTETIRAGAFSRTLSEGADVRALVDHDPARIIGRNKAGTLTLEEDERGLAITITPPDTQVGRDTLTSIRRGDVDGMSFGFVTREDSWSQDRRERELIDVDLHDVSVVTYPAYPDTTVAARSRDKAAALSEGEMDRRRRLMLLTTVDD